MSPAYSPLDHLAWTLWPGDDQRDRRLMAMFTAYFDASGNHLDRNAIYVAGFVGVVQQWGRFEAEWFALLKAHRLANPFHMTEFMAAAKDTEYEKWRDRQGEFLIPAMRLIKRRIRKDVSQGLVIPDFNRIHEVYDIPEEHPLGKTVRAPLAYCGVAAVMQVKLWELRERRRGHRVHGDIKYVFDRGDKHRGELAAALRDLFQFEPILEDKAKYPGIQAADILAWCHRRAMADFRAGKRTAPDPFVEAARQFPGAKEWAYGSWPKLSAYCDEKGFPKKERQ